MFVLVFDDHHLREVTLQVFFGSCIGSVPIELTEEESQAVQTALDKAVDRHEAAEAEAAEK